MKRKEFLQLLSPALMLLGNGKIVAAQEYWDLHQRKSKLRFRFVVASDGHYGEEGTDYIGHFNTLVSAINDEHKKLPFAFGVINGDIVHDDKRHYPAAKAALDQLAFRYYVSQGNHDQVTPDEWLSIWNMPVNFAFVEKKKAFLIATTSNEKGVYLCPDLGWFTQKLEEHKNKDVFIFIHINPGGLTRHAVKCEELFALFGKYKNIRAVFNGHDHDEEGIKIKNEIPFIFDAHFGGSWGTDYRGFRVVEIMKDNSVATYIMNPRQMINQTTI